MLLVSSVAASAAPASTPASKRWLESRQSANGGFAETGGEEGPALTAWASLALVGAGGAIDARRAALSYLRLHEADARTDTDAALQALARLALGDRPDALLARLREHTPGTLVNGTIWCVLALVAADEQPPGSFTKAIIASQHRSGGWSWLRGGSPDSNDTAAAIQALRAVGVTGAPIARGVAALRAFANRDGGYALTKGRVSDSQSTAWAIQGLRAAGEVPARSAFRYLGKMRRSDGSYRYSSAYDATPVWVTSQVTFALSGRILPLRP